MGPSVVVVTDNDPELARREAKRLADMLLAVSDQLVLDLPSPLEAVKTAMAADEFPITLMDTGDNIGGGSPGRQYFHPPSVARAEGRGLGRRHQR